MILAFGPHGRVEQIDADHHGFPCALDSCGQVVCWVENPAGMPTPGRFTQIGISWWHACGLTAERTLKCWGRNTLSDAIPEGEFQQLSVGYDYTCAIRIDGTIACFGTTILQDERLTAPPDGTFVQLATGYIHACGLRVDGTVACWGAGETVDRCPTRADECGQSIPPAGTFTEVAVGYNHSCGIRTDGSLECWGSNTDDRATPPEDFP